jgi:hypothetical protein
MSIKIDDPYGVKITPPQGFRIEPFRYLQFINGEYNILQIASNLFLRRNLTNGDYEIRTFDETFVVFFSKLEGEAVLAKLQPPSSIEEVTPNLDRL